MTTAETSTSEIGTLKQHFNDVAGGAAYGSYEERRWKTNTKVAAQHDATATFIEKFAVPLARAASTVSELGPGPGTWTKVLYEANPKMKLSLFDISGEMLARAKSALPADAAVSTQESDFISATLPESAADFFFSSRALEYISPKKTAIEKIEAHLKSSGHGLIITKMPKRFLNSISGRAPSAIHQGQVSPSELALVLRAAGLTETRFYPVTFSFPVLRSAKADRFLGSVFGCKKLNPLAAFFAESYAVIFTKP